MTRLLARIRAALAARRARNTHADHYDPWLTRLHPDAHPAKHPANTEA